MMQLAGTSVLLTGAAGGIGAALCAELAGQGVDVIAVGRDAQALARLAARTGAPGDGHIVPVAADITRPEGRELAVGAAAAARAPLRCVIHNAGVSHFGLYAEIEPAAIVEQIEVNLLAPMLLTRALLSRLLREPEAALVGIGSTFGSIGYPGYAGYCAGKFGLRGFLEALAREHADAALRVLHVSPRATRTAMNPAAVEALNRELGVAVDEPAAVARQIIAAIRSGRRRLQLGWPEKLYTRINGALPALVDRSIARQLPQIRRHARLATT